MDSRPLAGRRVVELGTMIAAPFATHLLAQLGAEVIKVEPLSGDTTRALVRGGPSGTFIAYNQGKQSLALDLTTAAGQQALQRLLATADVLVHNLAPGSARKLHVAADEAVAAHPKLVVCHIRGYAAGPQQDDLASNPVAEAATGVMEANRVDGRPSRLGPSYHDQFAGAYAVIRVLAALMQGAPDAQARRIEIGLYETGLHVAARDLAAVQLKTQLLGRPEREPHGEFSMPGYGAYCTRDGRWLYLLLLTDAHWARLTRALGMPEAGDPALQQLRQRKKARERVEAAVRNAVGAHDFDDAVARLRAAGVGCTEVLPIERVLDAPQARQPGKLRELGYRGLHFEVPEFPGATALAPGLPPPELGEHTRDVLRGLGYDDAACAALLAQQAAAEARAGDFAWAEPRREA